MTTKDRNTIIMRCIKRGLRVKLIAESMGLTEKQVLNIIKKEEENGKTKVISNWRREKKSKN